MPIRHKSIKLVRTDRLKTFMDRRLIQALRHPVREHILAVLNERAASPVEIGDEIELDVTAFHKQVELLEEMDLIELVGEESVGGPSRHFYRAKATVFFDDEAWEKVPESIKSDVDAHALRSLLNEVIESRRSGTFNVRRDRHLSWMPLVLDQRGWGEIMALLSKTLAHILKIHRRSTKRIQKSGEPGITATIGILGFERSPGSPESASS